MSQDLEWAREVVRRWNLTDEELNEEVKANKLNIRTIYSQEFKRYYGYTTREERVYQGRTPIRIEEMIYGC